MYPGKSMYPENMTPSLKADEFSLTLLTLRVSTTLYIALLVAGSWDKKIS